MLIRKMRFKFKSKHNHDEQKKSSASVSRREMFTWFLVFFCFYTMCREWLTLPSLHLTWSPGLIVDDMDIEITRNHNIPVDTSSILHESNEKHEGIRMKEAPIVTDTQKSRPSRRNIIRQPKNEIRCSKGEASDLCDMVGDIRIHPNATTVYYVTPSTTTDTIMISGNDNITTTSSSWTMKPYARNDDASAMALVTKWSIKVVSARNDQQNLPNCSLVHESPGVLFSLGGYSGNHYHGFADVLIPLFVTARPFNRRVEFVIIDGQQWMVNKVKTIMQALSRYDEVDVNDRAKQDGKIHCFSRLIVGLRGRGKKELGIDPLETNYTMTDFRKFLRSAYSLNKTTAIKLHRAGRWGDKKPAVRRPRLLIISRKSSRTLTNVNDITGMAKKLGYRVKVVEPDIDMSHFAEITNSCDVVMGVHGAGLTNMVFLPDNAIVVQVIPLALDWSAQAYYHEPTKDMNLRYLEYKIKNEESSLMGQYPPDDAVFTNPWSFKWEDFKSIYLENQNVTVDLRRFRPTLLKALELLHH